MNWNVDWTAQHGHAWAKVTGAAGVPTFWMFTRAAGERIRASGNSSPGDPATGTPVARAGTFFAAAAGFPAVNDTLRLNAIYFARKVAAGGGGYSPEGRYGLDGAIVQFDGSNAKAPLPFPPPSALTRRWRRAIYALSNPGSAGQRARFVYMNGSRPWYAAPTTDPSHGTTVTTPAGQGRYSGRYFDHDGSAWVESPDQATPANVVSETGVTGWKPGDLVDGNMLNDVKAMANEMTRTVGFLVSAGVNDFIGPEAGFQAGIQSSFTSASERTGVSGTSAAAADANYNAAAGVVASNAGIAHTYKKIDSNAGPWRVLKKTSQFRSPIPAFAGAWPPAPNPDGKTRVISFWVRARRGSSGTGEWDAYGDGVLEDQWHEIGPRQTTSSSTITGPDVGTLAGNAPQPWPAGAAPVERGWSLDGRRVAMILDWETAGGFEYTASAP